MTTYDFEGGTSGAGATTALALCEVQVNGNNAITFDPTHVVSGGLALKMVTGTTGAPTNASTIRAWGTGVTGAVGTTFGTPNRVARGPAWLWVPSGGFDASSGTATVIGLWSASSVASPLDTGTTSMRMWAGDKAAFAAQTSGITSATNTITQTATPVANGDAIAFTNVGAATNIVTTAGAIYYVVGKTTNTFQVAATVGGTALTLGTATGLAYRAAQPVYVTDGPATHVSNTTAGALSGTIGSFDLVPFENSGLFIRWELDTNTANNTGVGHIQFSTDATNPNATQVAQILFNNYNLGSGTITAPITRVLLGYNTVQASSKTMWIDAFDVVPGGSAVDSSATPTPIYTAALSAPTGPTAVIVSTDQFPAAGSTITLNSTGSTVGTGGGSLNGYAWTCTEYPAGAAAPSITTPTASSTTVTLAAVGHYVFQLVVTQTGGSLSSSPATYTEYVHSATGAPVGIYAVGTTDYTNEGGAASLAAALNDGLTTTYAQSQPITSTDDLPVTFLPCSTGPVTVTVSLQWFVGACNATVLIYKADGVTLLYTSSTFAVASTWTSYDITLDSTALTALGDSLSVDRYALKGIIRAS